MDAYAGYNKIQNATQVLCITHAMRGFAEAIKALPEDKRHKDVAAKTGLAYCNRLYDVERQIK